MSPFVGPLVAIAAIVWLILLFRIVLVAARMFQIEEYESVRFLRWGLTREWLAHRAVWLGLLVGAVALSVAAVWPAARPVGIAVAWLVSAAAAQFTWRWTSPKRPLVMTARMRRLLIAGGFLAVLLAAGLALGIVALHPVVSTILVLIAAGLVTGMSEILLVAANVVTKPAETRIRRHYLGLAAERLREVDPIVVAVVGSFGKTSTKHILAQLLQPHVNTLPTRKSFNTLMGVTRVINEDLTPDNKVFVVEMDAYAEGEIAAMSNLVHPGLAIITAIGPQHMERFGTIDRIANAMYEVIAALPPRAPRSCTPATSRGYPLQSARKPSSVPSSATRSTPTGRRPARTSLRRRSGSRSTDRPFAGAGRRRAWIARSQSRFWDGTRWPTSARHSPPCSPSATQSTMPSRRQHPWSRWSTVSR